MDTVSVVVIVIVGLLVIWGVVMALSNFRHDPPKKVKKEHFGGGGPGSDRGALTCSRRPR